ncbi:Obg family GTPase CgtA [Coxiella endosymbiont of Amblyomma americanum]|uniref:Obg family GTPase CgtA n=1 Tax=Coxiella endosymbiont of Amblyomma americanum TaxID=325775 RepID=UPI00057FE973|nr:GTPase ObgE [Coxiella endosymbiont of Amblyomma americanum]AJC50482.1 GTPase CgtA [Coxiella endosymbiont of Amblyomma americanum]AUJ58821.1 GTPase Obg [Coxiella-like endosymbiont of Amblyomma americanum]
MKFIDEVLIQVEGGNGGDGCLSFRREKFISRGGPDGGNGGDGGSVYLIANKSVNTLVRFCYQRILKAQDGQSGMNSVCSGKRGADLVVSVPIGTGVYYKGTGKEELMSSLIKDNQKLCVARGGKHGLGNIHFKSSINRAPRKRTFGKKGEKRTLKLELRLLADVGLLGLPNAGKSTFLRSISKATPKIADYPFTTLYPNLGMAHVEKYHSFTVADIPGIIKGSSTGVGLGTQFLKHIERTHILLHVVDISPIVTDIDLVIQSIRVITEELKGFNCKLLEKSRWLVFNKIDLLSNKAIEEQCKRIVKRLSWRGPVYTISAIKKEGTQQLCNELSKFLYGKNTMERKKRHF